MSQAALFVIGVAVFATSILGLVLYGGTLLTRAYDADVASQRIERVVDGRRVVGDTAPVVVPVVGQG